MMSSISSKILNYQQMLNNPGFLSSEHQVLFQKIGFYMATVQYQHVVIPIPLWETIQELIHISDELWHRQEEIAKPRDPLAKINTNLIKSTRARIAKLVNNINNIIESLPEDQQLIKWMIGEMFGAMGVLMGMFNSWKITPSLTSPISIQRIWKTWESRLTAMLKNNPAQLITEIDHRTWSSNMNYKSGSASSKQKTFSRLTDTQVFGHLKNQAEKQKLELLISKPLDLFQINTSYLHTDKTLTLILYIPMVARENKLNLLQFIPFMLSKSLGANTTVTHKVNKDLSAVGKDHQYKILGQMDLAGWTQLGQNILCEGRSVLRTDIKDSCLGHSTYTTYLEYSSIANFNWEKQEKRSSKLDLTNDLCQHQKNLHQSCNVKNHMKSSLSTRSPPSRLNLDANYNSSCTSFNLTPINDHNYKLDITHGTGTSKYSFPQQI